MAHWSDKTVNVEQCESVKPKHQWREFSPVAAAGLSAAGMGRGWITNVPAMQIPPGGAREHVLFSTPNTHRVESGVLGFKTAEMQQSCPPFCVSDSNNATCETEHQGLSGEMLTQVIVQLGQQIGESIVSQLVNSKLVESVNSPNHDSSHDDNSVGLKEHNRVSETASTLDLSKLNVIVKSEVKEPPTFRGDETDKCNVYEWEEVMQNYLRKKDFEVQVHSREIMEKLRGKAKDVVKIAVRNSNVDLQTNSEVIFSILKQHFGDAISSTTPLADFYATLPRPNESAFNYWIRVNKSMDLVTDCLQRRGRKVDDPGLEVAMLFIRHCPDAQLATAFKTRPLEKWSVQEVQDMLDSHQRELRLKSNWLSTGATRGQSNIAVESRTTSKQAKEEASDVTHVQPEHKCSQPSARQGSENDGTLTKLVDLLAKALNNVGGRPQNQNWKVRSKNHCQICDGRDHSTKTHCIRDRLCFTCFSSDHSCRNCPVSNQATDPVAAPKSDNQQEN